MLLSSRLTRIATVSVCFLVVMSIAATASACPSCKQALGADGSQGDLARGIYYSILFMMSMPFAIVGSFGFMAYRAVKREQRRVAELEQAQREQDDDVRNA
jgi:hypothetical protein